MFILNKVKLELKQKKIKILMLQSPINPPSTMDSFENDDNFFFFILFL